MGPTREECVAEAVRGLVDSFVVVAGRPPHAWADSRLRCPRALPGRQKDVLRHGPGCGVERALVAVAPPHQVRRAARLAANLDNHSCTVVVADVTALHDQLITDMRLHDRLLPSQT